MNNTVVIVNPAAGRGRCASMIAPIREAFETRPGCRVRITRHAGDEARLVREALGDGAGTIVSCGGDGTWNRCAAAILDANAAGRVRIAFVAAGTGNDFAKNLGAPARDVRAMAALVANPGVERHVDVGAVESGGTTLWFLNVAGFGFDAVVLADLARARGPRFVRGYTAVALRRLLDYPGFAFTEGGTQGRSRPAMMLVFSNGATFGGSFRIAPAARVDDGLLDQVAIGDVRGFARLPLFVRALRGAHVNHPKVRVARRARFDLTFAQPPECDLDGELVQLASRDATVRAVPRALRVAAPG
ncbi:MAG: hypothetical protein IT356_07485 [Gemmatimonadaceae bacterium]|nr:hypothetical protein [Gemmatimonadaceae bacterium]